MKAKKSSAKKSPARKVAAKKVVRRNKISARPDVLQQAIDMAKAGRDGHKLAEVAKIGDAIETISRRLDSREQSVTRAVKGFLSHEIRRQVHDIGLATSEDLKWLREEMSALIRKYGERDTSPVAKPFECDILHEYEDESSPIRKHNGRLSCGDVVRINGVDMRVTGLSFPNGRVEAIFASTLEELPLTKRAREIAEKQKDLPRMDITATLERMPPVEYTPEQLAKIDEDLVQAEMVDGELVVTREPDRSSGDEICTVDDRGRMGQYKHEDKV